MRKVARYSLGPDKEQLIELPKSAEILSVGLSGRLPVVWAMIDPDDKSLKVCRFFLVPDNSDITFPFKTARFLGTVTNTAGKIRHIFMMEKT